MKRRVDKVAFGARTRRRRIKLGLSQLELANEIGMKQQGIGSIEKGEVSRPRFMRELASVLETTQEWLLWEEGKEEAVPPLNVDELVSLVRRLKPAKQRRLLRTIKAMQDEEAAA